MYLMSTVKSWKTLVFLVLTILLPLPQRAAALSSNFSYEIQSHLLSVHIDPSSHFIRAEDQLELRVKRRSSPPIVSFLLNSSLRVVRIADKKQGNLLRWEESLSPGAAKRVDVYLASLEEIVSVVISYEGKVYDPVVKEKSLHFVRGDETSGLIGGEGVYLTGGSQWYPDMPDSMAIFHAEVSIPAPYRAVTQGQLLSEVLREGLWKSRWSNDIPAGSLTLVAGKYVVRAREAEGVALRTYFFEEDERFSDMFLEATAEYLKIYSDLLGPYPFKKFDVVENFFASGYGFPSFTLLAPEAIRQGREFLKPGALDHEIVHSWWGHSVSYKPGTGNWVEALTTYCANYYYRELKLGRESARKYREDVLQHFAIMVPASRDYPLRRFEVKRDDIDGQIGYGKGSMVFHMLRRVVGKNLFFATLKDFGRYYEGKQATWGDLQRMFEQSTGISQEDFFSQWLDRSGGPHLKLGRLNDEATEKGYRVSGEIVQSGDIYQLRVPIEIERDRGAISLFEVSKRKTSFSIDMTKLPSKLTLDPDCQIFRRLYPEEVVPGLNALLEDREKIFVLPETGNDEIRKIYADLANMAKERKGGKVLSERDLTEEDIKGGSLMLLGRSWKNPLFSKMMTKIPGPIAVKDGRFIVDGKFVDENGGSLLLTFHHPSRPDKWVTIYFGETVNALSRARYIFFYGWDSYLLFERGRPLRRGNFPPQRSFVTENLIPPPQRQKDSGAAPAEK